MVPIIRLSTKTSPKCRGSMPSCDRDRHQDRDQDQHRGERFHEAADDEQQQVDDEQDTSAD